MKNLPLHLVKTSKIFNTQSVAFDYVKDKRGSYLIVEISYGSQGDFIYYCMGYWNEKFDFIEEHVWPEYAIFEDFIK